MTNISLESPVLTFIFMDIYHSFELFIEVKDEASTFNMEGYVK